MRSVAHLTGTLTYIAFAVTGLVVLACYVPWVLEGVGVLLVLWALFWFALWFVSFTLVLGKELIDLAGSLWKWLNK